MTEKFQSKLLEGVDASWNLTLPLCVVCQLQKEYEEATVFPSIHNVFRCFKFFKMSDVKVVLLGQDPYINEHIPKGSTDGMKVQEACGLSFAVPEGLPTPPSLRNIFKELQEDTGTIRTNTNLQDWAQQGVLLLNSALTVRAKQSNSHADIWEAWTDQVIRRISNETSGVVFVLLGAFAKGKKHLIDATKHCVLEAGHPSPLNRKGDFKGSKLFSRTNSYLQANNKELIKW